MYSLKICSIVSTVVGAILVVVVCVIGFVVVPNVIRNTVINEVVLLNDTIQMERFEELPFPLNFTVRFFNITNPTEVMEGGIPIVNEVGPYVYRVYRGREVELLEEDHITFKGVERFEFDTDYSYPHTEDDVLTLPNVPLNAVLQVAEELLETFMSPLNSNIDNIFGEYNQPVTQVSVRDILFDGMRFCVNPSTMGRIICNLIETVANSPNIQMLEDKSIVFSLLGSKASEPTESVKMIRGINEPTELATITEIANSSRLSYWTDFDDLQLEEPSYCNMLNGSDGAIFPPFIDREKSIYAYNFDICRSAELRYQYDTEFADIPVVRYTANEWMYNDDNGCFCLNRTIAPGYTQANGCLLPGAMELYTCVGAHLVLTNPHFLYAHPVYNESVIGLRPDPDIHRISVDLEPNTGIVIHGYSRAQFNIFLRPVTQITSLQPLRTTLAPIFWVEDGVHLPEEFVDEVKTRLLRPLNLVDILIPVFVALSCLFFVISLVFLYCNLKSQPKTV